MKKLFLASLMMLSLSTVCLAQGDSKMESMKEQQKVLKLNTKLNGLRMDYQKAIQETAELQQKAAEANAEANSSTTAANDKLAKSQKKVKTLEKKIRDTEAELAKLDEKIQFVDQ